MSNADGSPLTWTIEDDRNSEAIRKLESEKKTLILAIQSVIDGPYRYYEYVDKDGKTIPTYEEFLQAVLDKLGVDDNHSLGIGGTLTPPKTGNYLVNGKLVRLEAGKGYTLFDIASMKSEDEK